MAPHEEMDAIADGLALHCRPSSPPASIDSIRQLMRRNLATLDAIWSRYNKTIAESVGGEFPNPSLAPRKITTLRTDV